MLRTNFSRLEMSWVEVKDVLVSVYAPSDQSGGGKLVGYGKPPEAESTRKKSDRSNEPASGALT